MQLRAMRVLACALHEFRTGQGFQGQEDYIDIVTLCLECLRHSTAATQ